MVATSHSCGSTLAQAVWNAREAIMDAFDAPQSVATSVQVVLRLDAAASAGPVGTGAGHCDGRHSHRSPRREDTRENRAPGNP